LYGPNSLQSVFAGNEFHPNAPIKREEAARLLQLFTVSATDQNALQQVLAMDWLQKEDDVQVKRGEAAVVADKISQY
ncbi:S-layer homology domain-containing protein, partial [Microbacteriaceae bacterium K1510]|nr:S-layer homology domain-containing protein [Microbacteriaceae bacterium K1510]